MKVRVEIETKSLRGNQQVFKELSWLIQQYKEAPTPERRAKQAEKLRNFNRAHGKQISVLVSDRAFGEKVLTLQEFLDIITPGWRR